MARISLAGHWKFRRFVRALTALPPAPDQLTGAVPVARGILELLWEAGYAAVSDYVGRPAEIAEIVQWTGDPAVLVTLLVDAGFLDVHAPGEYRIHAPNVIAATRWARGQVIGRYRADFAYQTTDGTIIEDVKGVRTALYTWKKKHVEAEYGVRIVEV